jgi:hypothetical protein
MVLPSLVALFVSRLLVRSAPVVAVEASVVDVEAMVAVAAASAVATVVVVVLAVATVVVEAAVAVAVVLATTVVSQATSHANARTVVAPEAVAQAAVVVVVVVATTAVNKATWLAIAPAVVAVDTVVVAVSKFPTDKISYMLHTRAHTTCKIYSSILDSRRQCLLIIIYRLYLVSFTLKNRSAECNV